MFVYVLAVIILALDQIVKFFIRTHMTIGREVPVFGHFLVLDYIQNPGAAWSMFGGQRGLLILIALVVIAAIVYVQVRYRPGALVQIGMGLLLGGAIGNLVDRILFGKVTDFIYIQVINYPIFNLADSAIVVGVLLILIRSFFANKTGESQQQSLEERE